MKVCVLLISMLLMGSFAFASKTNAPDKKSTLSAEIEIEEKDIRCEKLIATPLADFKSALVENCDLKKPFSSSLSRVLNDEVYFYCCHKKQ